MQNEQEYTTVVSVQTLLKNYIWSRQTYSKTEYVSWQTCDGLVFLQNAGGNIDYMWWMMLTRWLDVECACTCTCAPTHTHTHMPNTHTHTHTHTHTQSHMHVHTNVNAHTLMHIHTNVNTHVHTHTDTDTDTLAPLSHIYDTYLMYIYFFSCLCLLFGLFVCLFTGLFKVSACGVIANVFMCALVVCSFVYLIFGTRDLFLLLVVCFFLQA